MALNNIDSGEKVNIVLTVAVVSGEMRMLENILAVAMATGEIGDTVAFAIVGEYSLPKAVGAINQGDPLNYDVGADNLYPGVAAVGDYIGVAVASNDAGSADVECSAILNQPYAIKEP